LRVLLESIVVVRSWQPPRRVPLRSLKLVLRVSVLQLDSIGCLLLLKLFIEGVLVLGDMPMESRRHTQIGCQLGVFWLPGFPLKLRTVFECYSFTCNTISNHTRRLIESVGGFLTPFASLASVIGFLVDLLESKTTLHLSFKEFFVVNAAREIDISKSHVLIYSLNCHGQDSKAL